MSSYVFRREEGLVDFLIPRHDWITVRIQDGTSEGGTYFITVLGQTFAVADPAAGADSSSTIVSTFITDINNDTLPVTAYAGAVANELRLRHDKFGGKLNVSVDTDDPNGSMRALPGFPDTYDVQMATNWDAAFANVEDVPQFRGYTTPALKRHRNQLNTHTVNANQLRNYTRYLFDFEEYGYVDTEVNFMQVIPNFSGSAVSGLDVPINIILTRRQLTESHTVLVLTGEAPVAADYDNALRLLLPRQTSSYRITNLETAGGDPLLMTFGTGDSEITVAPEQTISDNRTNIWEVTLRSGGAGTVTVELLLTLNPQRLL